MNEAVHVPVYVNMQQKEISYGEFFSNDAEVGLIFSRIDTARPINMNEISSYSYPERIRFLSLSQCSIKNYDFLEKFSNLELIILPMYERITQEGIESLLRNLEEKEFKKELVVLYSNYLSAFYKPMDHVVFRNIHNSC